MTDWYIDGTGAGNPSAGNGTSWAEARQKFDDATTTNYSGLAAGDTIRVYKSPDPYSIGNATWTPADNTNGAAARTVTLATAQTLNIDLCESGWVSNGTECTCTHDGNERQGTDLSSLAVKLTKASSFSNSTLIAYKDLGATGIDFSSYQRISFWIKNSVALVANNWVIKLCSDQAGATAVDEFPLCNAETTTGEGTKNPPIPSTARYVPLTILKSGGGNLGSAIKSVAIYSGSTGMAAGNILIDNIIACTTSGLNLQSLISPIAYTASGAKQGGAEQWYCIRFINDDVIEIDTDVTSAAGTGRGFTALTSTDYSGAVATSARETIKPSNNLAMGTETSTTIQTPQDFIGLTDYISFEGGYNAAGSQDGETFYDGLNGYGYGLAARGFRTSWNYINFVRYYNCINGSGNRLIRYKNTRVGHSYQGISSGGEPVIINEGYTVVIYNNSNIGFVLSSGCSCQGTIISCGNMSYNFDFVSKYGMIKKIISCNSNTTGIRSFGVFVVNELITKYNNTDFIITQNSFTYISKLTLTSDGTGNYANTAGYGAAYINDYNGNGLQMFGKSWSAAYQESVRVGSSGKALAVYINETTQAWQDYPIVIPLGKIAVAASTDVTLTVQMRHNNTGVKARLCVRGGQLAGIDSDVYSDLLDTDTVDTWVTKTLSLTGASQPDVAGVVELELHTWTTVADKYLYVDSLTVA